MNTTQSQISSLSSLCPDELKQFKLFSENKIRQNGISWGKDTQNEQPIYNVEMSIQ